MGFKDVATAAEMREIIRGICESVIDRMNIVPRIGKVTSVNSTTRTCTVQLSGDTATIKVSYGKGITPLVNDVVRFQGKPGAYYILNFVSW